MQVRKIFFWLHLTAGCIAGAIILLMSFTGLLLTYEKQILAWVERGPVRSEPPPGALRLEPGELVEAVRRERGDLPGNATLTLRSDPREPIEIRSGREGAIYVDGYTGKVLAAGGTNGTRVFFQKITAWHRWLGVEGQGRATAKAITGACNLCFLFIVLSGAYLWLPRRWSWQAVRSITWFRREASGKARDFNWHNVFGVWALVPLFFVVLTALPMSYPWANDLVYRMTGTEPPPRPAGGPGGPGGAPEGERRASRPGPAQGQGSAVSVDINGLWSRAVAQETGWKSITARIAITGREPVSFAIDAGEGGQPQKRSTLLLDPATGAVVRWEKFEDANAGRRLRMWSRFVHTGEYYGLAGQTIAGLASAAGVMLVWTGISLALRRFAAWNARRRRRGSPQTEETATVGADETF